MGSISSAIGQTGAPVGGNRAVAPLGGRSGRDALVLSRRDDAVTRSYNSKCAPTVTGSVKRPCTRFRPAEPSRSRSPASETRRSMAARNAVGSPGGTSRPVTSR